MDNNYDDYVNPVQSRTFSGEQKNKLIQVINEGMKIMLEVETLNGGLADTIKAVAEEMDIPASVLKKAVKTAHKATFTKTQQDHQLLEDILMTVGKTL